MKIEQIKVVAGLILKNNKLLICQRPKFKDHPLKWEFPGGKIKNDETNEEALIREINEELSIQRESSTSFEVSARLQQCP